MITCLSLGLEFGVMSGVVVSLIMLLYQQARPRISIVIRTVPNSSARFIYVKPDRSVFFPSVEYMKIKINKAIPNKKNTSTIEGVQFQDSRDLGDISERSNEEKSVVVSYSTNTIPQSFSDSKLTTNGIENSKTNIIDMDSNKVRTTNDTSNAKGLNGKQRANTVIGGLQPSINNELVVSDHLFDNIYDKILKSYLFDM